MDFGTQVFEVVVEAKFLARENDRRLDLRNEAEVVPAESKLANQMMHPSNELQRVYAVRALGELSDEQLEQLKSGVELDDGEARFDAIEMTDADGANKSYLVTVSEGRNRIIRRMFEAVGCRVNRLMRVSYGPVSSPRDIRPGKETGP